MRSFSALLVSAMAALTTAYTKPDYNQTPTGNTIAKPGLHDLVTAEKPYTIEWKPSTEGPVSLVLLRGPSTNVKPLTTLAESIDNLGSYEWTPSTDLEPDTTHYGLMLVVEGTGQYQYSTQFGVDNPHYHGPANATTTASNATSTAEKTHSEKFHTYYSTFEVTRTICPKCSEQATATPSAAVSKETIPVSVSTHAPKTTSSTTSSTTSAPTTVATTASSTAHVGPDADADASPSAPAFTGAAGRNTVGLGGVVVAAGVLAVLAF